MRFDFVCNFLITSTMTSRQEGVTSVRNVHVITLKKIIIILNLGKIAPRVGSLRLFSSSRHDLLIDSCLLWLSACCIRFHENRSVQCYYGLLLNLYSLASYRIPGLNWLSCQWLYCIPNGGAPSHYPRTWHINTDKQRGMQAKSL